MGFPLPPGRPDCSPDGDDSDSEEHRPVDEKMKVSRMEAMLFEVLGREVVPQEIERRENEPRRRGFGRSVAMEIPCVDRDAGKTRSCSAEGHRR
jgi:hypothetical protein